MLLCDKLKGKAPEGFLAVHVAWEMPGFESVMYQPGLHFRYMNFITCLFEHCICMKKDVG